MAKFSENIVNQRFRDVYLNLEKTGQIKGKSDIAKHLETYNHVINSILKGQRNITVDQLYKLFEIFGINANYLFGNSDDMFLSNHQSDGSFPSRSMRETNNGLRRNITLVPNKAMAGYAVQHESDEYFENLPKFGIPDLEGDLIAFEISGDSMMPTITSSDIVVCQAVERGEPLRDNHVYVIVTDVVVAKRIQQIREGSEVSHLRLISDNNAVYKPYEVDLEEIQQILKVKCRVTNYAIS